MNLKNAGERIARMLEEGLSDSGGTSKDQNVNRVAYSEHWIYEASYNLEKRQFMLNASEEQPASYLCHKTWLRQPFKLMCNLFLTKKELWDMTLSLVSENTGIGVLNSVETVKIIATLEDDLVIVIL